ncbi:MAG: MBL fold metallo-hydrolase [Clostridia bacterium]|nr:MBL fold metallo-hydrolase [Clostridia bacterium]
MTEVIDKLNSKQLSKLKIINCLGSVGGDCFLIRGKGTNILVDSGFAFCAEEMLRKVKAELKNEKLDYILLTHSHYDHAMGIPLIKREYPEVKVIGSEYCSYILTKPTARKRMQEMDCKAAKAYGKSEAADLTEELYCDITLKDNEEILLGEEKIRAIALPGHTRCCMGFYFIKEKLLVSCETLGIYANNMKVFPGCLIGYRITLDSIEKVLQLDLDEILIPHSGILYKENIKTYLEESKRVTDECKELILNAHCNGKDFNGIVEIYKERYYSECISESYPEHAMMANLSAQIPMFINECTLYN